MYVCVYLCCLGIFENIHFQSQTLQVTMHEAVGKSYVMNENGMYACMYVCDICMYVCDICMYVCMHASIYILYVCMYVCMYVCLTSLRSKTEVYVCIYVCYVYACIPQCLSRIGCSGLHCLVPEMLFKCLHTFPSWPLLHTHSVPTPNSTSLGRKRSEVYVCINTQKKYKYIHIYIHIYMHVYIY